MSEQRFIDPFSYPDSQDTKLLEAVEDAETMFLDPADGISAIKPLDGKICFYYRNYGSVETMPRTWRGYQCIFKSIKELSE